MKKYRPKEEFRREMDRGGFSVYSVHDVPDLTPNIQIPVDGPEVLSLGDLRRLERFTDAYGIEVMGDRNSKTSLIVTITISMDTFLRLYEEVEG